MTCRKRGSPDERRVVRFENLIRFARSVIAQQKKVKAIFSPLFIRCTEKLHCVFYAGKHKKLRSALWHAFDGCLCIVYISHARLFLRQVSRRKMCFCSNDLLWRCVLNCFLFFVLRLPATLEFFAQPDAIELILFRRASFLITICLN